VSRTLEFWLDPAILHTVWDRTWNQWKYLLGTKIEVDATFVRSSLALLTAMLSVQLAAQGQNEPRSKQTHYIVKDLGTLGGSHSVAEGVGDEGWITGSANLAGNESGHAF